MEQLPLSVDLVVAEYKDSARQALRRATAKEVAYLARCDADSVNTRFRLWNHRKHPTAIDGFLLRQLDEQHAREDASLHGYTLIRAPAQEPSDSLRELEARAAKGFVSAEELRQIMARTRMPTEAAESSVRAVPR